MLPEVPRLGEYYSRDKTTWKVVGIYINRHGDPRIRLEAVESSTLKIVQLPLFLSKYRRCSRRHAAYRGFH